MTDLERGLKVVFAVLDLVTLGGAIGATKLSEMSLKEGLQAFGKTVVIDFASNTAACGVSSLGEALDWPVPITMMLSLATGISVSISGNKMLFKNADGITIGSKTLDDEELKIIGETAESGSKTISYTDYDNIYQSSIHNAGKEKVMLGKYDGGGPTSYITKAGDDYTYFSLGNEWNTIKAKYGFTDDDMFKLFNEAFLDDGINAGKTFQFSHNPINDTGALGQEYQYLLKNNYRWDAGTMTMKPRY